MFQLKYKRGTRCIANHLLVKSKVLEPISTTPLTDKCKNEGNYKERRYRRINKRKLEYTCEQMAEKNTC